jgi:sterol 3beta-glucosyltransferase
MKRILLMSLGSRGDMEPFLALGEELKAQGNQVAFCLPAQFEYLAKQVSPLFYPMSAEFLELMNDPQVRQLTGQLGSAFSRFKTLLRLLGSTRPIQEQLIRDQKAADEAFESDEIIYHIKCVYPTLAHLQMGKQVRILSPALGVLHPLDQEPAIGFGQPGSKTWNRFTYRLANHVLIQKSILSFSKTPSKEWGWTAYSLTQIKRALLEEISIEYAVSSELIKRPHDWPKQAQITRFRERNKSQHWNPDPALQDFLIKNPKPLFVTFGSMVNAKPAHVGQIILDTTAEAGIPVLINSSWGGIEVPSPLPSHAIVVSDIPYDWLLSRVCAIVHHGGSGTTHSAWNFRLPQLIIPHFGDQFFWNRIVQAQKMGPLGPSIKALNKDNFKTSLKALLSDFPKP